MAESLSGRELYCLSVSTKPSALCNELLMYTTENHARSTMLVGSLVGSYLGFMVEMLQAKRVLEIGCFTGYSALCMAERLPSDGTITTLDVDPETVAIAQSFWKRSPHGSKIDVILGPALESFQRLKGPFDLIFVDADKENYPAYATWAIEHLSEKGMLILDNCLWSDQVWDPKVQDAETKGLRQVASMLSSRSDLSTVLVPVRDGLLCARKRPKSA